MIVTSVRVFRDWLRAFSDDAAQDVFEYVLIIGVLTVAVLVAVATPVGVTLINAVVGGACAAINTVIEPDISCAAAP